MTAGVMVGEGVAAVVGAGEMATAGVVPVMGLADGTGVGVAADTAADAEALLSPLSSCGEEAGFSRMVTATDAGLVSRWAASPTTLYHTV